MQRLLLLLFVLPYAVHSQTGPGGVSSGTTNLLLWLDSKRVNNDGSNPAVNSEVATWHDQSGNNRDVTRNVNGVATYLATGVRFNSPNNIIGSYLLGSETGFPVGNTARTAIVCASSPTSAEDDVLFVYGTGANNNNFGILKPSSGDADAPNGVRSYFYGNDLDIAGGFTPVGTFKIITALYNPNVQTVYVNNSAPAANIKTVAGVNTIVGDGLQIGGWSRFPGNGTSSVATISEVIFYNKALNAAEILIVNNYLAAKYSLTLAANDVYTDDNNGFDYDVAGIGQATGVTQQNLTAQSSIVTITGANDLEDNEYYIWGHNNLALTPSVTTNLPLLVQARLARVWAGSEIDQTAPNDGLSNFDVRFDLTNMGNVDEDDLRLLIDTDDDGVFNDLGGSTTLSGAVDLGSNIYEFSNVTQLTNTARFTLGTVNTTRTPLPIQMFSFDVTSSKDKILLNWTTASETNNDYFQIERSLDGLQWIVLDTIDGAGDSKELISYEYADVLPYHGRNYYRLKQVDFDGKFEYSMVKTVDFDYGSPLFPNPTTGVVNLISKDDHADLTDACVYDLKGQSVNNRVAIIVISKTQIQVDLTQLPPGMYVIKTRTTTEVVTKE